MERSPWNENHCWMLEELFQHLDHRSGIITVNEAMIERRGYVHDPPDSDRALLHDRTLDRLVEADDGHFRRIDDGRRGDTAQLAETRDRDGGAHQLLARRLVRAGTFGHPADLRRQRPELERLRVAHHRYLEAVRRLRGDPDMHRAMPYQHAAGGVVQHVALREGFESPHQGGDHQRQIRVARLALGQLAVQVLPQRLELGDVDLLDIGKMRNRALRLAHSLGDQPTNADHLDLGGLAGTAVEQ